ncbi:MULTISPECIES: hypothetical protein [unclassified Meridianimarinicoccus]|uniref:hypothetical protein n=1 Tax=unclassified Meridianimarinicoccus TaxID=2923344 RepID=UPI0018691547|nr:hypothetical protein [Fluviibacterium sp. MJW13]
MKAILRVTAVAAALLTANAASAAVVVYGAGPTPAAANAMVLTDISVGNTVNVADVLSPQDLDQFKFTALERLRVNTIALTATGTRATVRAIEYGLTSSTTMSFLNDGQIFTFGPTSSIGVASLNGFIMNAGDMFSLYWSGANTQSPASINASFTTSEVPLPAALPLLAGALGLLGMARRKAKS